MEKLSQRNDIQIDNMESILEEFRHKISQSMEKDRNNVRELAEQESTSIIVGAREEADKTVAETRKQANKEVEKIIAEANQKAIQTIKQAEEKTKNEAKEKTKKEKERILEAAKEEAETLVTKTRQVAQEEARKLVTKSQKEEADAAQVLAEATGQAQKLITDTRNKARTMLAESDRVLIVARQTLEQAITAIESELKEPEYQNQIISGITTSNQENQEPVSQNIESGTDRLPTKEDDERTYAGRLKLHITQPRNSIQNRSFEEQLLKIPHLRLIAKGGSADGEIWANVELDEPLHIVKLLKEIPTVKTVFGHKDRIIVSLESKPAI